jgi:2-oxoacid:acceptor oxidoreductase delta subunit (pyruvate/2-ketoisovalerate family)
LQLGRGAQFVIDRGMGRKITQKEAMEILDRSEEAGLVHCTNNRQDIDFLCNCCACHCVILQEALAHPKPGLAVNSGFQPVWNDDRCTACETCIDRCPMDAINMAHNDVLLVNLERCIGCGVCATGCPEEAIVMEERTGIPVPPLDKKELKEKTRSAIF